MAKRKDEAAPERDGKPARVPKVEQPDPRSPQFQEEVREEIEKEKLDP
jgi:hypothetical protein